MKIAFFIGTFKVEDGVTRVLLELAKVFEKLGHEGIIVTGWAEDTSITSWPVIQVPSVVFPFYREYRIAIPGAKGFSKKLDEFKPDVIHFHSPDTIGWAGLRYAKDRKIPVVATYHTDFIKYLSYYHFGFLRPGVWKLFRRFYNQMNAVTAPSDVISKNLIDNGISKAIALPWGVDFKKFNPSFRSQEWREKILVGDKKTILLDVGRITWEKDLKTLAQTYKLLKEKRNDFVLVFAGDGPQRKELEKLMPGALFLGHVFGAELSKVYASSDILLFPSSTETFGNVTVEAMASGLIPVVANAGGSKSLVESGKTGYLCEARNPTDFFHKTDSLLDNFELQNRMRESIAQFIKSYSWDNVAEEVLKLYQKIIDE